MRPVHLDFGKDTERSILWVEQAAVAVDAAVAAEEAFPAAADQVEEEVLLAAGEAAHQAAPADGVARQAADLAVHQAADYLAAAEGTVQVADEVRQAAAEIVPQILRAEVLLAEAFGAEDLPAQQTTELQSL